MMGNPKRWDLELLENYIDYEDVPLIQSFAINQDYHRDGYCWRYTKSGMYIVNSRYWVATNLLREATQEVQEPSIKNLQAFA